MMRKNREDLTGKMVGKKGKITILSFLYERRFLKERVISDRGHLSNNTTAKYLKKIVGPNTKNIILAHISEKNNTKEKVLETIKNAELRDDINIFIADQYENGPLIEV